MIAQERIRAAAQEVVAELRRKAEAAKVAAQRAEMDEWNAKAALEAATRVANDAWQLAADLRQTELAARKRWLEREAVG